MFSGANCRTCSFPRGFIHEAHNRIIDTLLDAAEYFRLGREETNAQLERIRREAVGEAPPTVLQKGIHTWLTNKNRKNAPE